MTSFYTFLIISQIYVVGYNLIATKSKKLMFFMSVVWLSMSIIALITK